MRVSCNGCRVLRKGCSDSCELRPCLQWIRTSESQANATVFLAKFYGRSGLLNLINSGPEFLRPTIFRSLLYEACGRIVNPIFGSVGLIWSGNWHICQTAVESVLKGYPLQPLNSQEIGSPPPAAEAPQSIETVADKLRNVRSQGRFKRRLYRKPSSDIKQLNLHALKDEEAEGILTGSQVYNLRWRRCYPKEFQLTNAEPGKNFLPTDSCSDSDDLIHLKTGFENVKTNCNPIENRESRALSEGIISEGPGLSEGIENHSEGPLQNLFQQNDNNRVENIMRTELTDEKNLGLELTLGSSMAETTQSHRKQLGSNCMDRPPLHVSSLDLSLNP